MLAALLEWFLWLVRADTQFLKNFESLMLNSLGNRLLSFTAWSRSSRRLTNGIFACFASS